MPHTIWTGAISFGLVHVPVRLISAVQDNSVDFHLLEEDTGERIHYQQVNDEGEEFVVPEGVQAPAAPENLLEALKESLKPATAES